MTQPNSETNCSAVCEKKFVSHLSPTGCVFESFGLVYCNVLKCVQKYMTVRQLFLFNFSTQNIFLTVMYFQTLNDNRIFGAVRRRLNNEFQIFTKLGNK